MKKIINNNIYSTENANLIHGYCKGRPGDECGFEEQLYQAQSGAFFLHGKGGGASKYPEEDIVPLRDRQQVKSWLNTNLC